MDPVDPDPDSDPQHWAKYVYLQFIFDGKDKFFLENLIIHLLGPDADPIAVMWVRIRRNCAGRCGSGSPRHYAGTPEKTF